MIANNRSGTSFNLKSIITILLLFAISICFGQVSVVSWNIKDFGKSKHDTTITRISGILKSYDIIALQEVVAGDGGAQAVARLSAALNLTGAKWEYTISTPTSGTAHQKERYAFLWKPSQVKKSGAAWLDNTFRDSIQREPYYCDFVYKQKKFTLVNYHAIPKKQQPETEIKFFKFLPAEHSDRNLIFLGDFNLRQKHSVFNPLRKQGYIPAFVGQKTSLRTKCVNGDCLASEYDNFWISNTKVRLVKTTAILFHESIGNLKDAKKLSDHIPIAITFELL